MRTLKRVLTGMVAIALLVMLSGCATNALWTEGAVSYHEPYPPSRLALFDLPERGDVLALYDELSPGSEKPRRRAYLLVENRDRVKSIKKPIFLNSAATNGLSAIPLYAEAADVPANMGVYARTNSTGNRVRIFRNDHPWHGAFDLPAYRCWITSAKRATLTPLTVVLDITVIGGFIYVQSLGGSGSSFSLPR